MIKLFCPDCGTNNSYASKKPNFCCNCGYKFASVGNLSNASASKEPESTKQVSSASVEDWFEFDKSHATQSLDFRK